MLLKRERPRIHPSVSVERLATITEAVPITGQPSRFPAIIDDEIVARREHGSRRRTPEFRWQLTRGRADAKREARHHFSAGGFHEILQDFLVVKQSLTEQSSHLEEVIDPLQRIAATYGMDIHRFQPATVPQQCRNRWWYFADVRLKLVECV